MASRRKATQQVSFTELETVLLLAVGVLLLHIYVQGNLIKAAKSTADYYAHMLISIANGQGSAHRRDDGTYYFKRNANDTSNQAGQG